jgi:signal transduction histidine kinase
MNQYLQKILSFIQQAEHLTAEEKISLTKAVKDTDSAFAISEFKLERTEKVKRTTAILLEETIEELEQKRKAVEAQNLELEIESSLERVRTVAMSMNKADDLLHICEILFVELHTLGFNELRNAMINIYDDDKSSLLNYDYSNNAGKTVTLIPYNFHPLVEKQVSITRNASDAFYEFSFADKELKDFRELRKNNGEQDDPKLEDTSSLYYYFYSIGTGSIGISTYKAISDEKKNLLKRFRNVFDLAYRRYIDITKAEAQAREAQIQLALERVRARTMAMQRSDELSETVYILFQQFKELGEMPDQATIGIINENEGVIEYWVTMYGNPINKVFKFSIDEPNVTNKIYKAWKENKKSLVIDLSGNALSEFMTYRAGKGGAALKPDEKRRIINVAFFSKGLLNVQSNEERSKESIQLLERFAMVFEQTYTRFLDLQKAEAQARESQIQLALERVRARTMAMQHSDELADASFVLDSQVRALGIQTRGCAFNIYGENDSTEWFSSEMGTMPTYKTPRENVFLRYYEAGQRGESLVIEEFADEACAAHYDYLCTLPVMGDALRKMKESGGSFPTRQIDHVTYFKYGYLLFITLESVPEAHDIFIRFAKVFEQTYTRFLDLQKAEAQSREAKIEAALEKVRARSMAMHKSDELLEAGELLWHELKKLDIPSLSSGYVLIDDGGKIGWTYAPHPNTGKIGAEPLGIDQTKTKEMLAVLASWKKQEALSVIEMDEQETIAHQTFIAERSLNLDGTICHWITAEHLIALSPKRLFLHNFNFKQGYLMIVGGNKLTQEQIGIMQRFTKVFEQTYTRFLDLQKAEAQAREAQIELGLERVRARAMAMQNSEELKELIGMVFTELTKLDLVLTRCVILIYEGTEKGVRWWMANSEAPSTPMDFFVKYAELPFFNEYIKAWRDRSLKWQYILEGENKIKTDDFLFNETELSKMPHFVIEGMRAPDRVYLNASFNNFGNLTLASLEPLSDEHFDILLRFAKVFDLTYTRFNDLKQAEAQAREAQIETALERVRSRSMAMHKSDELLEVINVVSEQLQQLNIRFGFVTFGFTSQNAELDFWLASPGFPCPERIHMPAINNPITNTVVEGQKKDLRFFSNLFSAEVTREWIQILCDNNPTSQIMIKSKDVIMNGPGFARSAVLLKDINVFIGNFAMKPLSDEQNAIVIRFANVFEQSYTRFLDLQKAEAQAREATIEAALEKVRGNAMAMHNSNDLSVTASMVFTELRKLGISPIRCGVGLLNKESRKAQLYSATSSTDGDSLSLVGWVMLSQHPVLEKIYDTWLKNEDYFPELSGTQLKSYYELLLKGLPVKVPDWEGDQKQYGHFLAFSVGCLYAWSEVPYNDAEIKILRRFASIIDLTFRRYIELQQSEANAKEAIKQAALDRIRADIASMRTISDLDRITPLIWNELTILGIPFIRCGVFIMDNEQQLIHTFLSTPEGKAIAAFHLPYKSPGNIGEVLNHWQQGKNYIDHWDEATFIEFADTLVKQGSLASSEQYMQTLPPDGFYLHFLPFLQGMLYVGNATKLGKEEIGLVQSVADAFSTAYARYEDFNKLEAAKKQVDSTLNELQATQKQLIQSEKMASLGELTAGIAHEIQNPLNFVNNFSEVNKELLVEMKEEIDKGNMDDAKAIATDVIENEEKINHHGKRADAIVKGMLQHSRSSTGVKEPTDINALADEYLRLAYHGLRAKDKSFNATMNTNFDETIGKINIIPQDIGRVVLNLLTNAFYVVDEKKKSGVDNYEPTVSISTKKMDNKVEIKVSDNGNGIPQKVLDKIFQPFFTTKPTGQGTGLGLSLSYDIVKAHGGELKVETKEGEGSTFIIQLSYI